LQPERKYFRPSQFGKWIVATALIVSVFISLLLAVSPALHERLHEDASQASHQCAITIFQQHQLVFSEPNTATIELNFGLPGRIEVSNFATPCSHEYHFSASRAPPAVSLL
jgi:hypothetical protein